MSDRFRDQLQDALAPAYTIEREITGGGMSRVYVANELSLGRSVVVKVLRPDLSVGVNRERFRREIMLAAQLQHPHIVPLLSAGEHGELLWYTMPFVEGESLRESLARRGKFGAREVARVLHDVLDSLAYAHRRGVIHRDIKPGNVLRHGAHSLVTDFGVAKALSAAMPHSGATSAGVAIGTPAYMAPEQLAADPNADHRMDLYAVGLLAYELLTGEQPFSGLSPQATMAAQLTRMPTRLEEREPDVPAPLAALVMRLLEKHPDERPPNAETVLEELDSLMTPQSGVTAPLAAGRFEGASAGGSLGSTPTTPVPGLPSSASTTPAPPAPPRRRRALLLSALAALVVAIGLILATGEPDQPTAVSATGSARVGASAAASATPSASPSTVPGPSTPTPAPPQAAVPNVPPAAPSAPTLTRADSLRIADAVRRRTEEARKADARQPGPDRDLDSLQRTLAKRLADSTARAKGTPRTDTSRGAGLVAGGAARTPQAPTATRRPTTAVTPAPRPNPTVRTAPGGKPRRIALLPVRDATARPELASLARALEDSLRRTLVASGFTLASDAELVRLLADNDQNAQRRTAESSGIGAVVSGILAVRGEELIAQANVLDVWRGQSHSERDESELDDPQGALGVVRDVTRALDRVSWRQRSDPRRILVFDFDNQTGRDDLARTAKAISDSLRSAARRLNVEVVGDSAVRATTGTNERRLAGDQQGVGAIVAGTLSRRGRDSVTVRFTVRDMSEGNTFQTIELPSLLSEPMSALPTLVERLAAELARVNWGPKGMQAPDGATPRQ